MPVGNLEAPPTNIAMFCERLRDLVGHYDGARTMRLPVPEETEPLWLPGAVSNLVFGQKLPFLL
jgi:hypothetical protein